MAPVGVEWHIWRKLDARSKQELLELMHQAR